MKRTSLKHISLFALAALALAPAVHAQTVITGGTYTGKDGAPNNLFNGAGAGYTFSSGTLAVSGGTFTGGNGSSGIAGGSGGEGLEVAGGSATITGGTFQGGSGGGGLAGGSGGDGLSVSGGSAVVSGGTFAGGSGGSSGFSGNGPNGFSFIVFNAILTIRGTFADAPSAPVTSGTGSFTGTLAGSTQAAIYTYSVQGGMLVFAAPAAAPEPSQYAAFAVGLLGLGALRVKARRQHAQ